jgi:putative FmdB family regulatory protein
MPIYEYRCRACGSLQEEMQRMGAPPPERCAACGGQLRRVYGRIGLRFSGWGFSRTDSLVPENRPKKDFKSLREKAEEIADG